MSDGISWYYENVVPYLRDLHGYAFNREGEIIQVYKRDTEFTKTRNNISPVTFKYGVGPHEASHVFETQEEARQACLFYLRKAIKEKKKEIKLLEKQLKIKAAPRSRNK